MRRLFIVALAVASLLATLACEDDQEDDSAVAARGSTPAPMSTAVVSLIDLEAVMGCLDEARRAKDARFGPEPLTYTDDYYIFVIESGGPEAVPEGDGAYVSWKGWEREYSQGTGFSPFRDTSYPFAEAEAFEDAVYVQCYEQLTGQRLEGRPW